MTSSRTEWIIFWSLSQSRCQILSGWRAEVLGIRIGLGGQHAGKKSSSNDERTRSFAEALLSRRTWIEILPTANASCHGCEEGSLAIIRPVASLRQDVSLSNISKLV